MTDDSFHCHLCGTEAGYPFICDGCSHIFCEDHASERAHYCGHGVYISELPNQSTYEFPLRGIQQTLVARVSEWDSPGSTFASVLLSSPVTLGLVTLLWLWFPVQLGTLASMGIERQHEWAQMFGLHPDGLWEVRLWITSVISHANFAHLALNSLVLAMFGPFVERRLGSVRFASFFFVTGIIAALTQVGIPMMMGANTLPVMGASGAIAGILGVLAVFEPDLRVYFLFVIPMSLGVLVTGLVAVSYILPIVAGPGVLNIGHLAHASGGTVGLLYGLWRSPEPTPEVLRTAAHKGVKILSR